MKSGRFGFINEVSPSLHIVVSLCAGPEVRPHGDHEVEVITVQTLDHGFRIGIARFMEAVLPHGLPPEPILHDVVHGYVEVAVFARNTQKFLLRPITVFALPKAISPFSKKRWRAGELTVCCNNLVELGTIEEVVVDQIRDIGTQVESAEVAIIEAAAGGIVPENPVAFARQKHRNGDVGVVL